MKMIRTLTFGCIIFLQLTGCNKIQDDFFRGESENSLEHKLQNQPDMISKSYDDYARIIRECLLKKDYNEALNYMLKIENYFPDRDTLTDDIFLKCYINLMLNNHQEVSKDLEYLAKQFPSSELFAVYWSMSIFEMRMKNYRKVIEYLDKIELPKTELSSRQYDGLLWSIHMTKSAALLILDEHEASNKEYMMFLEVANRLENTFPNLSTGFINLMNKAIEKPDEYIITVSDQPIPAPMPCPDDSEKIKFSIGYDLELVSKTDNTVVATFTVKL